MSGRQDGRLGLEPIGRFLMLSCTLRYTMMVQPAHHVPNMGIGDARCFRPTVDAWHHGADATKSSLIGVKTSKRTPASTATAP
jgi:hypothetical protein